MPTNKITNLAQGGTNAKLTASTGGVVYSGASAFAVLSGTATANQVLLSGSSAAPAWSTATYPATTTAYQLLYSSATNTVAGLTNGTTGQVLTATTGSAPSWATASGGSDPFSDITNFSACQEQFMGNGTAWSLNWSGATYNAGAAGTYNTTVVGHPGIGRVSTASSTNGGACVRLGNQNVYTTGGAITVSWKSALTGLSDGTDTYVVEFGLSNASAANTTITDGVWWRYTHSENSGKWTINTMNNTSPEVVNTNSTADTNWHVFTFVINSDATSVSFYIDGSEVANSPVTVDIPASTRVIGPFFRILKSAGTTDRFLLMDSFYFQQAY